MLKTIGLGVACATSAGLLAGGCGEAHQDAHEPRGAFTVRVLRASFPAVQAVARPARLVLTVHNAGSRALPNVAVAVNSFYYTSHYPKLAARRRPVWVVNNGPGPIPNPPVETVQVNPPGGGTTANDQIWALGPLAPGASRRFVWNVTPVKPGVHRIYYRVYAGLHGRAQAQLAGGGAPAGRFTVAIADRPPLAHVNPQTGKVAPGPYIPSAPNGP